MITDRQISNISSMAESNVVMQIIFPLSIYTSYNYIREITLEEIYPLFTNQLSIPS